MTSSSSLQNANIFCVQFLLEHRAVEASVLMNLYKEVFEVAPPATENDPIFQSGFDAWIGELTQQIAFADFAVQKVRCHATSSLFYVLVNTLTEDDVSRNTSTMMFKSGEVKIFRSIIEALAASRSGFVSSIALLNNPALIERASAGERAKLEVFVGRLVEGHWLGKHPTTGRLYLGVRTLAELGGYLRGSFSFGTCCFCKDFVSVGTFCSELCIAKSHTHCLERYRHATAQIPGASSNEPRLCIACDASHTPVVAAEDGVVTFI